MLISCCHFLSINLFYFFCLHQDIHKIENYLPFLEILIPYADATSTINQIQISQWNAALKIRWSSALTTSSFFKIKGPKFFQINNLRFELGMTLFLCGGILRERALEVLSTGRD